MLVPVPMSWLGFDYIGSILLSTKGKLALHKAIILEIRHNSKIAIKEITIKHKVQH